MNSPTLLSFLDAPVLVGDPDGRAAYVNPAFESRFSVSADAAKGQPLAILFEGGVREALLRAVAEVCQAGTSSRFRVRHGGVGYAGLASPIEAEDARVGFVVVMIANAVEDERIHALQREIHEPLDELGRVVDELVDQMAGRSWPKGQALLEDGLRALARARKWSEEFEGVLAGRPQETRAAVFEPTRMLEGVAEQLAPEFAAAGAEFLVQIPSGLPGARGEAGPLGEAIAELLRLRLSLSGPSSSVVLRARTLERDGAASVVIAVTDSHGDGSARDVDDVPESVHRVVQDLGGDLRTSSDPSGARTTAFRLDALKQ